MIFSTKKNQIKLMKSLFMECGSCFCDLVLLIPKQKADWLYLTLLKALGVTYCVVFQPLLKLCNTYFQYLGYHKFTFYTIFLTFFVTSAFSVKAVDHPNESFVKIQHKVLEKNLEEKEFIKYLFKSH